MRTLTALTLGLAASARAKTALIIVDTQLCFTNELTADDPYAFCNPPSTGGTDSCSRLGSLGVASGAGIVPLINQLRAEKGCLFDVIVRTQDYRAKLRGATSAALPAVGVGKLATCAENFGCAVAALALGVGGTDGGATIAAAGVLSALSIDMAARSLSHKLRARC